MAYRVTFPDRTEAILCETMAEAETTAERLADLTGAVRDDHYDDSVCAWWTPRQWERICSGQDEIAPLAVIREWAT